MAKNPNQAHNIKLVIVGEGNVGKTCILQSYINSQFNEEHKATIFENYSCKVQVQGLTVNLGIWDTAGQEEYKTLRTLAYPNTDVFLITFSVVDKPSFEQVVKVWYNELEKNQPKAVKIIIGNKIDLRTEGNNKALTQAEIQKVLNESFENKPVYLECSAKTNTGIKEIFDQALIKVLQAKKILKTNSRKSNPATTGNSGKQSGEKKICHIF